MCPIGLNSLERMKVLSMAAKRGRRRGNLPQGLKALGAS